MANNRYYIKCPVCKKEMYIGKSLGRGVYNNNVYDGKDMGDYEPTDREELEAYGNLLEEIYEFMFEHMLGCHKDEFKGDKLFDIVSEYKQHNLNKKN